MFPPASDALVTIRAQILPSVQRRPYQTIFSMHIGWSFHDSFQDKYPGILSTATCPTDMLCALKVVRLGQGSLSLRQEQVMKWDSETGSCKIYFRLHITVFSDPGALAYPKGRKRWAGIQISQQYTASPFWPSRSLADTCARTK